MADDRTLPNNVKSSRGHFWLLLLIAATGAFLLFLAITGLRIVHAAGKRLRTRLTRSLCSAPPSMPDGPRRSIAHGSTMPSRSSRGLAPVVITTGGAAQDPDFSEGGVGRDYLARRGIPEDDLIAETQGSDTAQSAQRVANIMRANGMQTSIAVKATPITSFAFESCSNMKE